MDVANVLQSRGHEIIPFEDILKRGAADTLVCRAAEINEAVLLAFDRDMRTIARRFGISGGRFRRLNLIHFQCSEPMAAKRLAQAMSFIEHEWAVSNENKRRLFVSIGTDVLRTHR